MAAKLAGVKAIIVHSHNTSGEHEKIHKIFRIIIRIFKFKRLACSKEAAIWMFRSLDNVTIIKNGIIADNFTYNIVDRNKVRNILGIDGKTVLIHIGRFHRQKNHIFLLDIFQNYLKNNPNSVLILVGRGELESEVVNKINTSKISDKVLLLGVKSNISELLSASDIFIFPSLYEGLGIALIEAQASGLYCIVSDTIPHEAIISDKLVRCPLGDMSVWVEAIIKIQSLEYDRNEYIQNVINNGFDIIINNNTLIKIYDEV
jgi:glycosyltransferase involved in cell wall biosynthesis